MSSSEFSGHTMLRRQFIQLSAIAAGGALGAGGFTLSANAASTVMKAK